MKVVINDLYDYYGLRICQDEEKFKFSLDSILLAEFVDLNNRINVIVDFCTGNAPVPMILSTKTNKNIIGFEVQEEIYNLAVSSIKINKLDNQISIIHDNINNSNKYFLSESVDCVTCNPPYFKYNKDSSLINDDKVKAVARHEIEMGLEDIFINAKYILKNKGVLYLVHRCDRLEEIISLFNKYNISVKKIQFIYSDINKDAIMVLIKGVKNGRRGNIKVCPPINITDYKSYKGIFDKKGD